KERKTLVERTRQHASAVEMGRADGDKFLNQYFLARRAAYSTVLTELSDIAQRSHLKERDNGFATAPVDGSDNLSMMSITANYEGTYKDLMSFMREIDRSPLLLIIESLNAAPQPGAKTVSVSMKLEAFVREDGSTPEAKPVASACGAGLRPAKVCVETIGSA